MGSVGHSEVWNVPVILGPHCETETTGHSRSQLKMATIDSGMGPLVRSVATKSPVPGTE